MGFTSVPAALRAASRSAGEKTGGLRGADCAGLVGRISGAMRGGKAASAAGNCRDSLSATFSQWCGQAQRFGENLGAAADRYARGDQAAAGVFPAAPTMRGPR
ncbi:MULTISPECIES: type VII secretion target [unclassified Amycolatopsis]|uniref:type VII secretion target n=1 Tax=unclassified Amycolatopsis TaxID=2618356 RepID=UPI000D11CD16|nr:MULTISPECIES: type VII secretion target [unclassified Amycolatopsis]